MANNLKARLSRLREAKAVEEASTSREPEAVSLAPAFLEGWESEAPFLWKRTLRYGMRLPECVDTAPYLARSGGTGPLEAEGIRFFDLETTGLSGGTGTIAFLAAIASPGPGGRGLALRQFFLADYPGEEAFLKAVIGELGTGRAIASYNGKAFDMPLLRTRCVLNGLRPPELPQLDLLHVSRRLWRSVHGGASLSLLGELVLRRDRGPDVPGSLIPSMWLDFVRKGRAEGMELVLSHNAEDVAGLALLAAEIDAAFASPLEYAGRNRVDLYRFGRSLLAMGRDAEGEALLELAIGAYGAYGDAGGGEAEAAAILLSRRYARTGRADLRAKVVERLGFSLAAETEKAKYYEHSLKDYDAALACVARAASRPLSAEARAGLEKRKRRLLEKKKPSAPGRGPVSPPGP